MELEELFFERHPNAMLIFDLDTLGILQVNRSATRKYGYSREEFKQLTIEDIRPEEDLPQLYQALKDSTKDGHVFKRGTYRHKAKNGEILHVQVTAQNLEYKGKEARVVHIHDLTEIVNLKNKYKNTLEEFHHHIDENPLAMVKFDHDFCVIEWSKRAEEKLGYAQDEVQGKTSFELGLFPKEEHELIKERIRQLTDGTVEKTRFNTIAVKKDGKQIHVRIHASALRTSDNNLKSVVAFIENINAQKRAELLLRTTEEMAQIGGWEYNPNSNELYWTNEVYRIYELPVGKEVDVREALECYISEDRGRLAGDLDKAVNDRDPYDSQYRLKTPDGDIKWVRAMGRPVIRNDRVYKVTGTLQDISEQKFKEQELQKNAKEKEVLLAEIHHRVKNNLAIISGLLELKALNIDDEAMTDILRQSQLRIQSMSMIHEALYEADDFSNLEFHVFVENLVGAIEEAHNYLNKDIELTFSLSDSLQLNVNQAIPCGLIINELVTNSFKHAFTGRDRGEIAISLNYEQQQNDVVLQVMDDGKGFPEDFIKGETNSLGGTLIQQLTTQLDGRLQLENRQGAFAELRFLKSDKSGSSSQHFEFS